MSNRSLLTKARQARLNALSALETRPRTQRSGRRTVVFLSRRAIPTKRTLDRLFMQLDASVPAHAMN